MKKHILLLTAVCSAFMLKAGDLNTTYHGGGSSDSKLTIGLSVGAGIPLSDFANKTKDTIPADSNKIHGFANTGFHFNATASYIFAGPLGAMVSIGGTMNSYDAVTATSVYFPHGGGVITATSYYVGEYLVGPCVSFGDKLKLNIHALVGLVTVNRPTTTITFAGGTDVTSGNGASGFGYNFGAGIKYNFTDKIGLLIDLGYTGTTANYTGYTDVQTSGSFSGTTTNTGSKSNMNVAIFTATAGIAFNL
jgi:opacity protein-like surface antigen